MDDRREVQSGYNCKGVETPMEYNSVLESHIEDSTEVYDCLYRQLIGCLMYIMLCTRPDTSFYVGVLSKFLEKPTALHWRAAKRVLRYLQNTLHLKLEYCACSNPKLVGYSDADWASSHDRKSTTGYLIFVGNNLVSWSSKKQGTVALSSTEAEIVAATEAT